MIASSNQWRKPHAWVFCHRSIKVFRESCECIFIVKIVMIIFFGSHVYNSLIVSHFWKCLNPLFVHFVVTQYRIVSKRGFKDSVIWIDVRSWNKIRKNISICSFSTLILHKIEVNFSIYVSIQIWSKFRYFHWIYFVVTHGVLYLELEKCQWGNIQDTESSQWWGRSYRCYASSTTHISSHCKINLWYIYAI